MYYIKETSSATRVNLHLYIPTSLQYREAIRLSHKLYTKQFLNCMCIYTLLSNVRLANPTSNHLIFNCISITLQMLVYPVFSLW